MMLVKFDSTEHFVSECKRLNAVHQNHNQNRDSTNLWFGNISWNQTIELTLHGDDNLVPEAEGLISQLDIALPDTQVYQTIKSPYGSRVNQGEWITGAPKPCRRRVKRLADYAPINIYVSTTSSSGVKADTMCKRGITILALLLKLQQMQRPVKLNLLAETEGKTDGWLYQIIPIESQPLDISVAALCLSHVGFARHLTYGYASVADGFGSAWPRDYSKEGYADRRAKRLGLQEQDILIPEVHYQDSLIHNPIKWLNERLQRYALSE